MLEYIDKTALYKEILLLESCQRELAEEKEVDEYTFIKRQQALEAAICYRQFVANFPAADVAPVVHGRWIDIYGCFETAECSRCHSQFEVTFDEEANGALWDGFNQFYRFCPNCGAKMDLEE